MKLTWLGHSAFRIETGGSVILIDPFLTGNPSFKGDPVAASAGATHVLVTHGHDDHVGDAVEIAKRTGAEIVSNPEVCGFLGTLGATKLQSGNTGGAIGFDDFSVVFTHALHSSGTVRDGRSIYLGNPNGFVIRPKRDPVVYHMGDTDLFSDMALIDELYRPKIGLVPIGDRYTMGGYAAARAIRRFFRFETVVPCHYATFPILAPNADEFQREMMGQMTRVLIPPVGEAVNL